MGELCLDEHLEWDRLSPFLTLTVLFKIKKKTKQKKHQHDFLHFIVVFRVFFVFVQGLNLDQLRLEKDDVVIKIGKSECNITSTGRQLTCRPPKVAPTPMKSGRYPEVEVRCISIWRYTMRLPEVPENSHHIYINTYFYCRVLWFFFQIMLNSQVDGPVLMKCLSLLWHI